ncbi:hypothetical protein ACFSJ3_15695 [Corallincola platygyrae]|uniref:Uncharacterized protein n=1 Tax=Corallincola platygyrae TaxID=1193278 RepID=A0ABW4XR51_9GAMM
MGNFDWAALIALAALCLALYNTFSGRLLARKQEELADVKNALHKVQLRLESMRALEMQKADFGARFVKEGKSTKLVITNRGKVEARDVTITFLEGPYFVLNQEAEDKFPMTSMDSMSSVRLLAISSLSMSKVKEKFLIQWVDDTGRQSKTFDIPIN